jgi:hypothetical protein
VELTEFILSQLVELQHLNKKRTPQELLARPPPKFVHDVAVLVGKATGFLPGLSEHWPEPREEKVDLLQHIADSCASALGLDTIDFDPSDVLKGKEVEKTLRLLQLLGIAASREKHHPGGAAGAGTGRGNCRAANGLTSASDMPGLLDVISRCVENAARILDEQRESEGDGRASPTRELENSYRALQEKLQEESQLRLKQDQRLSGLQAQLESDRSVLSERHIQLDDTRRAAGEAGGKIQDLRRQVDVLRQGLLQRAAEMNGNPQVDHLRKRLAEAAKLQQEENAKKVQLQSTVNRLTQATLEADTQHETLQLEVQRMKLRMAEGLDGADKLHQTEDIVLLQAEKQKLDLRLANLEEKLRNIAEADDLERKHETEVLEANQEESKRNDEVQMQLQVIIEERDALREGMDQLWQDKTRAEEELEDVCEGYTHLSDRLLEKSEESQALEEKLQEYERLLSMLQENLEKNHHSPAAAPLEPVSPSQATPPPVPDSQATDQQVLAPVAPSSPAEKSSPGGETNGQTTADAGADDASSHYSNESFEDDEDAEMAKQQSSNNE